jgi:PilZ domain
MPEPTLANQPDPAGHPSCNVPVIRYLVRPGLETGEAVLQGVCAEGIELLADLAPRPGAVLLLQLGRSQRQGASHTRLARVVRAEPRTGGGWQVGCRFTPPLSDAEVASVRRLFAARA